MILLAALQLGQSLQVDYFLVMYRQLYNRAGFGEFFYLLTVLLLGVEIFLGFSILLYQEWARKAVFGLLWFYLGMAILMLFVSNKNYFYYVQNSVDQFYEQRLKIQQLYEIYQKALYRQKKEQFNLIQLHPQVVEECEEKENFLKETHRLSEIFLIFQLSVMVFKFFVWYVVVILFFSNRSVKKEFINYGPLLSNL